MAEVKEVPCPFDTKVMIKVRYLCSCGLAQPLSKLYFCRHCLDLRCGFCVSHEVDSHYCPNCLENMPSAEARLKKNRCANCFDCPSCGHTLSTRATSMQLQAPTEDGTNVKIVTKKLYYLVCAFCRWTSRDAGLQDQTVASGGWPQPEAPEAARFATLQEHYRTLAQREKLEKETRRFCGRKLSYMQLTDKYGLSAAVARKRAGLPPLHSLTLKSGQESVPGGGGGGQVSLAPCQAKNIEEIEVLPIDELFGDTQVNMTQVTSLDQRLVQLDLQPVSSKDLFPRHKYLMIKRSQRCRKCEHNLSKPEYNPTSIKFKIQLAAYYHIPEVIIYKLAPASSCFLPGSECNFVLKLSNPTQHPTNVEFLDLNEFFKTKVAKEEAESVAKENSKDSNEKPQSEQEKENSGPSSRIQSTFLRQPTLVQASSKHQVIPNAKLVIPKSPNVYLPPRDDAAEFDDSGPDLRGIVDDVNLVAWRKGNKAGIILSAIVDKDVKENDEITVGFALKFIYTNTVPALEQREVQTSEIITPVYITLGSVQKN